MNLYPQGKISVMKCAYHFPHTISTVPDWWYLILLGVMFVLGVLSIELWHTQMPVWSFVIALLIGKPRILTFPVVRAPPVADMSDFAKHSPMSFHVV